MSQNEELKEFLYWNSWFNKYKTKPGRRFHTWKAAISLFLQRGGTTILETGCMRELDDWGAGCSTFILGEVCHRYVKKLYTVDNTSEHLDLAKNATEQFSGNIKYILDDSLRFLEKFTKPVDFLYLDSMDCPIEEGADALPAQKHALKELLAVYKRLTPEAIILLDDNDWENGGKTKLVKRFLFENGWRVVMDDRQSLWIRS